MLEVKAPGEKSSPNTGTSLIIPCERQPSQGLGVLTRVVGVSQSFDPDFSSPQLLPVQGHLNSMGAYTAACSASAFSVPQMHRANPNNFEPSVLHSPGVFWEHLPPTHPPGTFPSPPGLSVETHCSHHSVTMARAFSSPCQRMDLHSPKLIKLNTHREPTLFPSQPQQLNDHLLPSLFQSDALKQQQEREIFT